MTGENRILFGISFFLLLKGDIMKTEN